MSRWSPAGVAALLLLVGWAAAPAQASTVGRAVGVTLDAGPAGPEQAYRLFARAGANAIEAPQPWQDLEPARGRFHLGDVASIVQGVRSTPDTQVMLIPAA